MTPKRKRAKTIATNRLTQAERAETRAETEAILLDMGDFRRPRTRSECATGQRPCPFVSCKYHLFLDVNPDTGAIKINRPGVEVWEMRESCALDIADKGGASLEGVGLIINLTRERIRQVEELGLVRLKTNLNGHAAEVKALLPDVPAWEPK
jgi:hypothetical protein